MQRFQRTAVCLILCLASLAGVCFAETETPEFPDIAEHWAQETLTRAVSDGLLSGFDDGTLRPNAVITQAQCLQILHRVMKTEPVCAPEELGLGGGEWYADAARAAYDLRLIPDARHLSGPVDRRDAMILLCRALALTLSDPAASLPEAFREETAPVEVLSLVARGVVEGDGEGLKLDRAVTRAQFVTMLYRALEAAPENASFFSELGIEGMSYTVSAKSYLRLNELLRASAVLAVPESALGKTVCARWYLGNVLLEEQAHRLTEDGQRLEFCAQLDYDTELPETAPVALEILYWNSGGVQILRGESGDVSLELISAEYRRQMEEERVLALVDTGYEGDYTVEWARQHDYTDEDKTIWVNAKGYESETEYLIWVSIKYQRCNIFHGSQGAWTLVRSGIVGTGATWSSTPVGVWKTTYKQELGWTTATYTVKPVVRFKGGGYAFHSRLYAPNTTILTEPDVGYPMSHGCVRMLDEDIQWVFDNIPANTTVVVF